MSAEIVVLTRSLPVHGFGGMEIVAWELSRKLVQLGQRVRVLTTPIAGRSGEFEQDGVTIVPLPDMPSAAYSAQWWRASRDYFAAHCMASTQAVLSVSAAGFGLLPLKSALSHVPFVMQAHGTSWGEVLSKWQSRRARSVLSSPRNLLWIPKDLHAYRRFDAVVAVGQRVRRDLLKGPNSWALPASRVHLINNGIDIAVFRPDAARRLEFREALGIRQNTPIVISASRLHAQKGVHHCLHAFAELLKREPDAIYLIAGEGPEREALEQLAQQLDIAAHVRFLGSLPRDELAGWFNAADAFLFLTEHVEGLPLNCLEALGCGLPMIVSDHLNLFASPNIHLVPPRDAAAVARRLSAVLAARTSSRGSTLPDAFTLDYCAQQYLQLFAQVSSAQVA